jgi:hypothetical protein
VSVLSRDSLNHCQGYRLGKQVQLPYPSSESVYQRPFNLVHSIRLLYLRVIINTTSFL